MKQYTTPTIEIIFLDNEISLQLQSEPPIGPGEYSEMIVSECRITDAFKTSIG